MTWKRAVSFASAFVLCAPAVRAGGVDGLPPGTEVRVHAPDHGRSPIVGTLDYEADGTVSITSRRDGRFVKVPASSVRNVWVKRNRSRGEGALRGAGIGFLIAGVAGGALSAAFNSPPDCSGAITLGDLLACAAVTFTDTEAFVIGAVGWGMIGTLIGALSGLGSPGQRWVEVGAGRIRVSLSSSSSRATVGLAVRF
jgi:hypothetical protein